MAIQCECGHEATQEELDELRVEGDLSRFEPYECSPCWNGEIKRCEWCGVRETQKKLIHRCNESLYWGLCREADCSLYECSNCQSNRGEAAEQSALSDYYGGSSPQTVAEHQAAALRMKEGR